MSGDWAWNQVVHPDTNGSTFMLVILGSDKMTVSVATGTNDYYPLYVSIGNVCNNVRRVHRDAVAIIGFLAMPKTMKEHASCPKYRKYCRQLFHLSLLKILDNLRPGMTKPEVVRFGDGHYRHVIYGLGPYIADYEEQVLLACIVHSWCPRCMSYHKNLDAKLLCCNCNHSEALIKEVSSTDLWDEYGIIDDLIPFTNDFPQADIYQLIVPDLLHQLIKGTFKDHLVEIAMVASFSSLRRFPEGQGFKQWTGNGHVPMDVVCTFHAFLEFCYLVQHNIITESMLVQIQDALNRFHHYRKTKDIKAVKEPWRRLSCYKALGQMLVTNQRLDKLAASRIDFKSRGMLNGTCLSETLRALMNPDDQHSPSEVPLTSCPRFDGKIQVFNSASLTFYAPSNHSGIGGMCQEHIHACPVWRNEAPWYDCAFVNTDASVEGMGGMDIALHWFDKADNGPDEDTGMWIIKPLYDNGHSPLIGIIHVDSIYWATHLMPLYGTHATPQDLKHYESYDTF
ncbi:hypothetical protein EDB19DRAFT_1896780 [Suillus lakei]|nr:hypothetical protein EDB19DRAFT_1896780 [Suillus lakei]